MKRLKLPYVFRINPTDGFLEGKGEDGEWFRISDNENADDGLRPLVIEETEGIQSRIVKDSKYRLSEIDNLTPITKENPDIEIVLSPHRFINKIRLIGVDKFGDRRSFLLPFHYYQGNSELYKENFREGENSRLLDLSDTNFVLNPIIADLYKQGLENGYYHSMSTNTNYDYKEFRLILETLPYYLALRTNSYRIIPYHFIVDENKPIQSFSMVNSIHEALKKKIGEDNLVLQKESKGYSLPVNLEVFRNTQDMSKFDLKKEDFLPEDLENKDHYEFSPRFVGIYNYNSKDGIYYKFMRDNNYTEFLSELYISNTHDLLFNFRTGVPVLYYDEYGSQINSLLSNENAEEVSQNITKVISSSISGSNYDVGMSATGNSTTYVNAGNHVKLQEFTFSTESGKGPVYGYLYEWNSYRFGNSSTKTGLLDISDMTAPNWEGKGTPTGKFYYGFLDQSRENPMEIDTTSHMVKTVEASEIKDVMYSTFKGKYVMHNFDNDDNTARFDNVKFFVAFEYAE